MKSIIYVALVASISAVTLRDYYDRDIDPLNQVTDELVKQKDRIDKDPNAASNFDAFISNEMIEKKIKDEEDAPKIKAQQEEAARLKKQQDDAKRQAEEDARIKAKNEQDLAER